MVNRIVEYWAMIASADNAATPKNGRSVESLNISLEHQEGEGVQAVHSDENELVDEEDDP